MLNRMLFLCPCDLTNRFDGRVSRRLTFRTPHADDEAVQLTAQEVAFLLQLLDALLQPGVLLQSDVQVSSQVGHQDEGAVLRVRRLLHHRLCRGRKHRRGETGHRGSITCGRDEGAKSIKSTQKSRSHVKILLW